MLNEEQKQTILEGKNLICFHAVDQYLVNSLCETIRSMQIELVDLQEYKDNIENSDIPGEDN